MDKSEENFPCLFSWHFKYSELVAFRIWCFDVHLAIWGGFISASGGKESAHSVQDRVWSSAWEDPLEKGMATHSSWTWVWVNWVSDWQGGSACSSWWGRKESDTTELTDWPTPVFLPGEHHGPEEPGGLQFRALQRVRHN